MTWDTRRDCDGGEQTTWIKQIIPQRYVCVGFQFNSDQALRLLCLKGHVRARGSTLWRDIWQEASEFLRTKTHLLEGVKPRGNQKNRQKTWKCSLRRATNVTLSNFLCAVQKNLGVGSSYGTNKPPSGKPSFPYKCLILLFFSRQDE